MKQPKSKHIVFVTGAFVSNLGWDKWISYFEQQGYIVTAPAWPEKAGSPAVLRQKHPNHELAKVTLTEVVDHYASIISSLPELPIVIGHSLGGLITQLLVQRDLAALAVAYHSVPAQGVLSFKWSFLKSVTPAFGFLSSVEDTYLMPFRHWQYTFTNGMPLDYQKTTYDQLVIPESKRALRGAISKEGKIDFKRPHVPLLFVSGSEDNIMPASLNYSNYKKYRNGTSVINYKEFPGRNHLAMDHQNWKEDADYILNWIGKQ